MRRWFAAQWTFGEVLLSRGDGAPDNDIDDVIDPAGASVITLIGDAELTGLFAQESTNADDERESMDWARNENRRKNWTSWTVADEPTMNLIRRFHGTINVVTAVIKNDKTWRGAWEQCSIAKNVLRRMQQEVGLK